MLHSLLLPQKLLPSSSLPLHPQMKGGEDAPWLSRLIHTFLQGTASFVPSLEGMEGHLQPPLSPAPAQIQPPHPQQCFPTLSLSNPAAGCLLIPGCWKKNCC